MPRFVRVFLIGFSFVMFFTGSVLLGILVFPLLLPFSLFGWQKHRDRCTAAVGWGYGTFLFWLRLAGLIDYGPPLKLPDELKRRPFVLIANHPSLIDVTFFLHWFRPRLTCVVKTSWHRSWMFGAVLRSTHYMPSSAEEDSSQDIVERMVNHLQAGHPLMIFPEGTRSLPERMHRFKRGAFEAAIQAGVPILPVFIRVDPPMLNKGVPFWKYPGQRGVWQFEMLPVIQTTGKNGRELRNEVQQDYQRRFAAWRAEVAAKKPRRTAETAGDSMHAVGDSIGEGPSEPRSEQLRTATSSAPTSPH